MHMVKYGCDLLVPGTLKCAYLKNKSMNWADFLHAGSDATIFDQTTDHALYIQFLNTGAPVQLYLLLIKMLTYIGLPQSLSQSILLSLD